MKGSAASSGPSLTRAIPSASSIASSGACRTNAASLTISSRRSSAAPFTAPRPVNANWLAYVPEKPAWRVEPRVVAAADVHLLGRAAEDVGDHLSGRRLVALALRHRAEGDDDLAEDVELDGCRLVVPRELEIRVQERRLAEVVRPRVERRADPEAEELPARSRLLAPLLDRAVVDQLEHHVERGRVVARVVEAAVRRLVRHLLGLHVVPLAHLDRVEAELGRDDVDDPLGQPQVLHPRVAAVRRDGRLVRADLREVDLDVPPGVHPRRHLRPDDAAERLVARERAAVVDRTHLEAGHLAVRLHGDLDVEERALVPVRVRRVLVGAPLRPLHRPAELPRQQAEDDVLRMEADLVAEPAADVLGDEPELVDADAERGRHPDRADPGHLVVAVDRPLARALVVLDERARALERRRGEAVEVEPLDLHDVVRLGERRVDVAPLEDARPDDVRARVVVEDDLVLQRLLAVGEQQEAGRTRPRRARPHPWRAPASRRRPPPPARPCAAPCRPRARSP